MYKRQELHRHLVESGYSVSKRTLSNHKALGKFRTLKTGHYDVKEIDAYAARNLDRGSSEAGGASCKTDAEIRRINADADMRELKFSLALGSVIEASQVEIEMAKRAQGLKSFLESFSRGMAGQLIKLAKGDKTQETVVRAFLLATYKKAFDIYARPVILDNDNDDAV